MRVLGVDVATLSGWAVDRPSGGDKPLTGTFKATHYDDDLGRAYAAFEAWLDGMIQLHAPDTLAFEAPLIIGGPTGTTRPTNHQTVRKLFGLAAIVELVGARAGVDCYECHIGTVRRHFVGNGRADKREIMHRCRVLGWEVKDDNAADAAAIWSYAKATLESAAMMAKAARATA